MQKREKSLKDAILNKDFQENLPFSPEFIFKILHLLRGNNFSGFILSNSLLCIWKREQLIKEQEWL